MGIRIRPRQDCRYFDMGQVTTLYRFGRWTNCLVDGVVETERLGHRIILLRQGVDGLRQGPALSGSQ